jgi:hypothetical protein
VLGLRHPMTLDSIFSLALVYGIKQWRWKEAEVLMVQVIEGRESLFGPENATTLLAKANFAKILMGQGRWAEAEQLLVKVTDAKKRVLQPSSRPARRRRGVRGCHTLSRVNTV